MQQLIWYSIPGGMAVAVGLLTVPAMQKTSDGVLIAAAIGLGYALHQLFRFIFELYGGFESHTRLVLIEIKKAFPKIKDARQAYLVWELTFYNDKIIPSAFRDRDRGAWHYIMSFRSISLTALLLVFYIVVWAGLEKHWLLCMATVLMGILFYLKSIQTLRSLERQEQAFFKINKDEFQKTAAKLL